MSEEPAVYTLEEIVKAITDMKKKYNQEQIAEYFDYEEYTPPEDYICPYCNSPSSDVHDTTCPVNDFRD